MGYPSKSEQTTMKRRGEKLLGGLLLLLLLGFIWGNSLLPATDSGEVSGALSRVVAFFLGSWAIAAENVFRKLAHFTEFAALGVLLAWNCRLWGREKLLPQVLFAMTVALMDETLQLFSPGRAGMVQDVWLDLGGFLTGLVLWLTVTRLRERREKRKPAPGGEQA